MGRVCGKSCRLSTMMVMTATFFLVEIIVGHLTNSMALVADSFHMLSDVVALIVGFASVRISKWKSKRNTYGWQRAEVLGALVNSVFLVALCFSIFIESIKRMLKVEVVDDPVLLLVVGSLGLLLNIVGLFLFGGHGHSHGGGGGHGHSHGGDDEEDHGHSHSHSHGNGHAHNGHCEQSSDQLHLKSVGEGGNRYDLVTFDAYPVETSRGSNDVDSDNIKTKVVKSKRQSMTDSLNIRGVFLHVLGDALGSVVVVISALVIWLVEGDWKYYLDPAMSILMVAIILATTYPLFRDTAYILLQTVPRHVDVEAITKELKEIDGIAGVHECHIWQLAGRRIIASAHIHCKDIQEYMTLANKIKNVFHNAGIHSTTIQPEFTQNPEEDQKICSLVCDNDDGDKCEQDTCCGPRKTAKPMSPHQIETNNCNSNDVTQLLAPSEEHQSQGASSSWNVDMKMSPEGDEVVLDISKVVTDGSIE